MLATHFVSTCASTQNLIAYLSSLFGLNVTKEQQDFVVNTYLSMVIEKLQLHLVWLMDENVSNTSRIGTNLCSPGPDLFLWGWSSNLKYFRTFRYLSRGIVFEKIEILYSIT